jgi:protein MpaA
LSDALVHRRILLGYSVQHRPITAVEQGDPDSTRRALIVGCIHGNEPAGIAVARVLGTTAVPPEIDVWVVSDLNPDGVAARTRANADGVDLNRNFPYRWHPLGPAGSDHYAGPRPLSEPESRILARLVQHVRPTLGIWYHQALGVIDISQGPLALERRYGHDTGLPLRTLTDYPGSAVGFEDHLFGPTAFVVELPAGALIRAQVRRHALAVLAIANRSR